MQFTPICPLEQDAKDGALEVIPKVKVSLGENFRDVEKVKREVRIGDGVSGIALLNTSEDEGKAGDPSTIAVVRGVVVASLAVASDIAYDVDFSVVFCTSFVVVGALLLVASVLSLTEGDVVVTTVLVGELLVAGSDISFVKEVVVGVIAPV